MTSGPHRHHQRRCLVPPSPCPNVAPQGLLQLLALGQQASGDAEESDGSGAAVSAVQALQDVVEQLLAVERGQETEHAMPE